MQVERILRYRGRSVPVVCHCQRIIYVEPEDRPLTRQERQSAVRRHQNTYHSLPLAVSPAGPEHPPRPIGIH